jgi:hypothetical protein
MCGLACNDILNRPVRTTAHNPMAFEAVSEIAAFRLDGPQNAPSSPNRGLTKSAHGRMAAPECTELPEQRAHQECAWKDGGPG